MTFEQYKALRDMAEDGDGWIRLREVEKILQVPTEIIWADSDSTWESGASINGESYPAYTSHSGI